MKCVFCGENSEDSKSVEHIIPESMGNKKYTLPRGCICDKCNNYFSSAIEGPVLAYEDIKRIISYEGIMSKKGRVKDGEVLFGGEICKFNIVNYNNEPAILLGVPPELCANILNGKGPSIAIAKGIDLRNYANDYLYTRFLGKIAIEAFVYEIIQIGSNYNEWIDKIRERFAVLIKFVRQGNQRRIPWPVTINKYKGFKIFDFGLDKTKICCRFDESRTDRAIFFCEMFGTEFLMDMDFDYEV